MGGGRRKTLQLHIRTVTSYLLFSSYIIIIEYFIHYTISNSMKKNLSFTHNDPKNSFANKYGISMKENNSLGSMGLNPNLNIEDEYIENLLKQIHFMNMEIKLIKEKQVQSDGNALWGIINRTNQPMVSNIVQSNQKYQGYRASSDSSLYRLERQIAGLENNQGALQSQIKFLEKKKSEIEGKQLNWETLCGGKHQMLDQKIANHTNKLKKILEQLEKQRKKNKQLCQSQGKLILQDQNDKAKNDKEMIQIKNDEIIEEMMEKDIIGQIETMKKRIENLTKVFQENVEYIQSTDEQKILKEKIGVLEKNIAGANFQIMQLGQSIKMAELQRQKEIRERKKLTEDFEQKKKMLQQIYFMNMLRKQSQTANRKKCSIQIGKAEEQTTKLQKQLQEVKKKLTKSQQSNCTISNQVGTYQRQLDRLKKIQLNLQQKMAKLKALNDQNESELVTLNTQLNITQDQYQKTLNQQTNTSLDLFQLQKELQFLRGRKQLLTKSIQLKEVINGLNIEDLHRVVQKNNDLNSTVSSLMTKWDQIKDFSRI